MRIAHDRENDTAYVSLVAHVADAEGSRVVAGWRYVRPATARHASAYARTHARSPSSRRQARA